MLNDSQALGPALRLLRTRRRLRQYQVAEKAGLTKAMLSSYEVAGVKPSLQSLNALMVALESDLGDLQHAIDVVTGRLSPEEVRGQEPGEEAQQTATGTQVLEVLVPRMAEILPLLERIARALEGAACPGAEAAAPRANME